MRPSLTTDYTDFTDILVLPFQSQWHPFTILENARWLRWFGICDYLSYLRLKQIGIEPQMAQMTQIGTESIRTEKFRSALKPRPDPKHFTGGKNAKLGFAGDRRKLVAGGADPGLPAEASAKVGPASARPATTRLCFLGGSGGHGENESGSSETIHSPRIGEPQFEPRIGGMSLSLRHDPSAINHLPSSIGHAPSSIDHPPSTIPLNL